MNSICTVGSVEIDFLLGSFFSKDVTQYRDGRDVVGTEVTLPFAKIKHSDKIQSRF